MFLCIFLTLLKVTADKYQWQHLSAALQVVFPLAISSIPVLFLYYLYHCRGPKARPNKYINLVFLIPGLMFVISGYAFYLHYPLDITATQYYRLIGGNADDQLHLAQNIYQFTLTVFYAELVMVILLSHIVLEAGNDNSSHEYLKAGATLKRQCQGMHMIGLAFCIGVIVYCISHGKTRIEWLLSPGLFSMGFLMYRIQLAIRPKEEDEQPIPLNEIQITRIRRYFEESRPWIKPSLKIEDVAAKLNMNRTTLWSLMKKITPDNFNGYVNSHRVKEAKRLIMQGHGTEKSGQIARMAGFNSYSAFLRAFKKETGCSPQEYAKREGVKSLELTGSS